MATEIFTPEQVIKAIKETRGLVTITAQRLGCTPNTVRNYVKRYPEIAEALKEERETMTDVAELALFKQIQAGAGWAVCFYLKTQGRSRGYVERQELTGPDGGPVKFAITSDDMAKAKQDMATWEQNVFGLEGGGSG